MWIKPVEKRAGRDDERAARVRVAVLHREADDASVLDEDAPGSSDQPLDVRLGLERRLHPRAVHLLVGLRARRPHRRAAAAIEQLELNAGRVDRAAHQPAERVDLANEMTLCRAANRGIARHVRDGVGRQRAESDVRAEPRGRVRRLASGVAGADHDDVEGCIHDFTQSRRTAESMSTCPCDSTRLCAVCADLSLPDTESREDVREHIVRRAASRDFFERGARLLQIGQHEFFRQRAAVAADAAARARQARRARARTSAMCRTFVIPGRSRDARIQASTIAAQIVEAEAGSRRHRNGAVRGGRVADRQLYEYTEPVLVLVLGAVSVLGAGCRCSVLGARCTYCARCRVLVPDRVRVRRRHRPRAERRSATRADCFDRATPSASIASAVSRRPGGVDERDAQSVEIDDFGHQIARRAWHVGHDGARRCRRAR